jgi:glucose-1-phosphate thymidylyltransferase
MKNVVLAAGYATRLYPLTENFPKPLLEIEGTSILDRLIIDVDIIDEIDEHIVVCNHKFLPHFEKWAERSNYKNAVTILDDGSIANENRLGAVRDLLFAIETKQLYNDDLLVIAADNVLSFSFHGFVDYFKEKQTSLIMTHYEPALSALQRTGVIIIDSNERVLEMQEKPREPKSHNAVPPFYIYKKNDIKYIQECVSEGCNTDAPGSLVIAMLAKTVFHAWRMTGKRYDIGTVENYVNFKF